VKTIKLGIGRVKTMKKKWWSRNESCVNDGWDREGEDDYNMCWMSWKVMKRKKCVGRMSVKIHMC
jgi:hypothetical protein